MREKSPEELETNLQEQAITYQVQNKTFIVKPVFLKEGKETLGDILIRLMKSDVIES